MSLQIWEPSSERENAIYFVLRLDLVKSKRLKCKKTLYYFRFYGIFTIFATS